MRVVLGSRFLSRLEPRLISEAAQACGHRDTQVPGPLRAQADSESQQPRGS